MYTTIGPLTLPTYTLALLLATSAAIGAACWRLAAHIRPAAAVDAYLGALAGGLILARAGHVALNWPVFAYEPALILRLDTGGLDWHGAVIGALAGLALAARVLRLDTRRLIDALTPALPLLALAGWTGCMVANCGYGAEVDTLANYPALLVAELPDIYGLPAPRFRTQLFGALLSAALLFGALVVVGRGWWYYRRFWLLLALLSAGMFGLGFLRADYTLMLAGLRLDQWFDLGLLAFSLGMVWRD